MRATQLNAVGVHPSANRVEMDAPVFPRFVLIGLIAGLLGQAADPIITMVSTANIIGIQHNTFQVWIIALGMTLAGALSAYEAGRHTTGSHVPTGIGWVAVVAWVAVGGLMVYVRLNAGSLSDTASDSAQMGGASEELAQMQSEDVVVGLLMAGLYIAAGVGIFLSTSALVHHPWFALRNHLLDIRRKNQARAEAEAALHRSLVSMDHLNETMDLAVRDAEVAKQWIAHQALRLKQIARDEHTRLGGDPAGASYGQPHAANVPHPDDLVEQGAVA
ncbi:MAG: hypothetical protein LBV06_08965 [Propionibacteriaceae bacterium]|jgi:hypothetical protein|nr:hypothetical protein [Propionibacteriaceae bacterium]